VLPYRKFPEKTILNRIEIINGVLSTRTGKTTYLEIGVEKGHCFLSVKADRRVAVDPKFKIPVKRRLLASLKDKFNGKESHYFEQTSDDFFAQNAAILEGGIDAAFVDGLHTYQQSYQDVKNCLKHLKPGGAIMMHDCSPPNRAAAFAADSIERARDLQGEGWKRDWCGDVWKMIVHLRSTEPDLRVMVFDCDFGVGVVTRGKPEKILDYKPEEIAGLSYDLIEKDRVGLLNLKPPSYMPEFLNHLRSEKA